MWYVSIFDAKPNASLDEIRLEREKWIKMGKDRIFSQKCRTINRYEVLGISPLKIIFVIETDDPSVLNLLTHHFENAWNSVSYPIVQREIYEAIEEDKSIVAG